MKNDDSLATPQLAGYLAQELIGRGGMGEVYRALDVRLDRPVALKVLAARVVENERARERLLVESRLAASLDHPNVVPIYEAGEQDGQLFIAMRYVPGRDLRALLRREGALAPERAVAIARQVAGALDAAHRGGLVHRDVKPSNVLLDRQDEGEHCYLADFGLTQSPSERGPTDGQFMGTVAYVSPEQIRGEQVDGRADQYGLACLLFECLTGTVPYGTRSDVAVIFAHLEEPVPPASGRPVELPAALDPVLGEAWPRSPTTATRAAPRWWQPSRRRWVWELLPVLRACGVPWSLGRPWSRSSPRASRWPSWRVTTGPRRSRPAAGSCRSIRAPTRWSVAPASEDIPASWP